MARAVARVVVVMLATEVAMVAEEMEVVQEEAKGSMP